MVIYERSNIKEEFRILIFLNTNLTNNTNIEVIVSPE